MSELLQNGLKEFGFLDKEIPSLCQKMESYIKELILFNSAYNLTNTSDHDELVTRHILDSLSAAQNIKKIAEKIGPDVKIADIGSGGGLPGIPLAAAFPQFNFFLVERMAKRCAFLENCAAILGLKNVTVWNKEAEKVPAESFDISVFRAFRPLDEKMIKTLLSLTKTGGFLAAYKAKSENIKTEMDAINKIVPEYNVEKLFVPGLEDSERNLVIVKK
ncbi:MAG: 16S rRNA (guanine(527)-N(7))-methyltransferase RsmG [Treponema bryantii]|nr:16S rRNA (guanine(527)-N(7))-methyltransferase RsmG [Treponema bryantii]